MFVMLSQAACQHIAYLCNERSWRDTGLLGQAEAEELRLQFVKAALGDADPMLFTLTRPQVRALDMLLTDADPRDGKLPDGTRVLDLVESIWRNLIGDDDARDQDDHANSHTGADAGAALSRS
jgi:hypothetical protein